jgi:hypothetical protein
MRSTPGGSTGRVRLPLAAAATAALALALAACTPPVMPRNRPRPPVGVDNGALPAEALAVVNGCAVHQSARNALLELLGRAAGDGIALAPRSCYRDLAGQVAARERACAQGNCATAATPGQSNHGWGKAVDFMTTGGQSLTFDSPAYRWLKNYGWRSGWNHPDWAEPDGSTPEPWHWEWVGDGGVLYPDRPIGPQS